MIKTVQKLLEFTRSHKSFAHVHMLKFVVHHFFQLGLMGANFVFLGFRSLEFLKPNIDHSSYTLTELFDDAVFGGQVHICLEFGDCLLIWLHAHASYKLPELLGIHAELPTVSHLGDAFNRFNDTPDIR